MSIYFSYGQKIVQPIKDSIFNTGYVIIFADITFVHSRNVVKSHWNDDYIAREVCLAVIEKIYLLTF